MKRRKRLLIFLFVISVLTGCGKGADPSELKSGPTVTPMPDKATENSAEYSFDYTDEEVDEVLRSVLARAKLVSREYAFEITENMRCDDLVKHEDKTSEVYVYDEQDNMIAVLMYNENKEIYRAYINTFEKHEQISGCVYEEGRLTSYFETEAGTGEFRVEVEFAEDGYRLSYVGGSGEVVYRFYSASDEGWTKENEKESQSGLTKTL